ncbi:MAG TPA: hypothetical protein VHF05_02825 [Candidatus Paceibacterota bacterium]|nr:hypothetical protein [Candidatus Paceibacterota bacterium]
MPFFSHLIFKLKHEPNDLRTLLVDRHTITLQKYPVDLIFRPAEKHLIAHFHALLGIFDGWVIKWFATSVAVWIEPVRISCHFTHYALNV